MPARALITVIGALLALVSSSGCPREPPSPPPKPTVDTRAIVDVGPYWCDVIPRQAVRIISGLSLPLTESTWGVPTTHGGCLLRNGYTRFSLYWSARGGDQALDLALENFGSRRLAGLPADLGEGLIAYTGESSGTNPYVVFMLFRCGDERPWMGIDFSEAAKGRNVVADSIALLRIARHRYGEIHECTDKPA
ncbi:hypothetical protein HII36_43265 [Nonomuraea sp. NN258]|uniref:hypothetical protein n=1 Tax=Nonomuraea antri TaxID=2730852 RepID=UPI00156A6CE9|nr:hypothetical protein [Nonomuraea antri]NRQ38599.1 hypothetical protein [Nonomuraea antri]